MGSAKFWSVTAVAAFAVLGACESDLSNKSGYTKVPEVTTWSYNCGGDVKMNWEFKDDDKGRFIFNSGTVLIPANDVQFDRNFIRQDGVLFMVTGHAGRWIVRNEQTGSTLQCDRASTLYSMPLTGVESTGPQELNADIIIN